MHSVLKLLIVTCILVKTEQTITFKNANEHRLSRGSKTLPKSLLPYCYINEFTFQLVCSNFTSLDQLDFKQSNEEFSDVLIAPDRYLNISLDSKLDFSGLVMNASGSPPKITLKNFNGIDPTYNPFLNIKFLAKKFDLELSYVDWTNKFDCSYQNGNPKPFLFGDLSLNSLKISYPIKFLLCPVIFTNTTIEKWTYEALSPLRYEKVNSNLNQND